MQAASRDVLQLCGAPVFVPHPMQNRQSGSSASPHDAHGTND